MPVDHSPRLLQTCCDKLSKVLTTAKELCSFERVSLILSGHSTVPTCCLHKWYAVNSETNPYRSDAQVWLMQNVSPDAEDCDLQRVASLHTIIAASQSQPVRLWDGVLVHLATRQQRQGFHCHSSQRHKCLRQQLSAGIQGSIHVEGLQSIPQGKRLISIACVMMLAHILIPMLSDTTRCGLGRLRPNRNWAGIRPRVCQSEAGHCTSDENTDMQSTRGSPGALAGNISLKTQESARFPVRIVGAFHDFMTFLV